MAILKSPTMHNRIYAGGAHGNLAVATTKVAVKAAANDVIEVLEIPAGLELLAIRVATEGLGAGVKATIKLGETALVTDVDVAAAAAARHEIVPLESKEKLTLSVTITGGAAAGTLFVIPEYVPKGTI